MRCFWIALLLIPELALAQSLPPQPLFGPGPPPATAINVDQFGATGNGQRATTNATIPASSKVLVVSSAIFKVTDIGKYIVIPGAGGAGTGGTGGQVTSVPVATPGSGYTSAPSCAVTGSPGTLATCVPIMSLQSATVASGGASCTNGLQQFLLALGPNLTGNNGRFAIVSGTVSGGALSGALTVVDAGFYNGVPANVATATGYGPACVTQPTFALSFGVAAIYMSAFGGPPNGVGYPIGGTTAALTGGGASVAGTLGTPVIFTDPVPLITTITAVADSQHVTLNDAASATLSAASILIYWATDDTTAVQNAMNAAYTQKPAPNVFFPPGSYYFAFGSAYLDPGVGPLTISGAGMDVTELVWDGGTVPLGVTGDPNWKPLFRNTTGAFNALKGALEFSGLTFRGLYDEGRINRGGPAHFLNYYSDVVFTRNKWTQISAFSTQLEGINSFRGINNSFNTISRSGFRCRSCFNISIIGNSFIHGSDDSVDLHQAGFLQSVGAIREGIVVQGNVFEDTYGVHALGAREIVVNGNVFRRPKAWAIAINGDSVEGINQMWGITISDNQVYDMVYSPPSANSGVIQILATPPSAGTSSPLLIPGLTYQATGGPALPWNYTGNSSTGATAPFMPAFGVRVHDNIVMRTLPDVVNYSAWGYGSQMNPYVGFTDPVMPDASMQPTNVVQAEFNISGIEFHNNYLADATNGINFGADNMIAPDASYISIVDNQFVDLLGTGITFAGVTGNYSHVKIEANSFNMDPYRLSPSRAAATGTWTNGSSVPVAVGAGGGLEWIFERNTLENAYGWGTIGTNPHAIDNITRSLVSGTGWNASNLGVGNVPPGGAAYDTSRITPGQLTAGATDYRSVGVVSSSHVLEAASIPVSGTYTPGEFVRSTAPASCNCLGWARLTVGLGQVLGTDWTLVSNALGIGTTGSLGGGVLTAGACATTTVSIQGAAATMSAAVSPAANPGAGFFWYGYVSSANTVTVAVCASVTGTPTATTYNVRLLQ